MPDPRSYFSDINQMAEKFEKEIGMEVFVTSVKNDDKGSVAGATCSARPRIAAKSIREGTHRLATDDEVKAFKKLQADNLKQSQAAEDKKKDVVVVREVERKAPEEDRSPVATLTGSRK